MLATPAHTHECHAFHEPIFSMPKKKTLQSFYANEKRKKNVNAKSNRGAGTRSSWLAKGLCGQCYDAAITPLAPRLWPGAMEWRRHWQNATLNLIINYRAIAGGPGATYGPHLVQTGDCRQPQTQVNALEYTRLCTTPRMSNMRNCLLQGVVWYARLAAGGNANKYSNSPRFAEIFHYKLQIGLCLLSSCCPLAMSMSMSLYILNQLMDCLLKMLKISQIFFAFSTNGFIAGSNFSQQ